MILQPFFSTHGSGEALGLGLSIASAPVRRHGGSIQVESNAGGGATFTVRFPARVG